MKFIRDDMPQESVFISIPDNRLSDAIRYSGLKSVALSAGDVSRTVFLGIGQAMELRKQSDKWSEILERNTSSEQLAEFIEFACQNGATQLLIDGSYSLEDVSANPDLKILFDTNSFKVAELLTCE
ncbi:MAG: hypothetical protein JEZ00_19015 [Anaerolineaceae bacterium]|nr:hypothetical protein [Anaerolineaceae bacterium]